MTGPESPVTHVLRTPEPSDRRGPWLRAVVKRFAVAGEPAANKATMRTAEVIAKRAGADGICCTPRRALMEDAGVSKSYVLKRAIRDLTEAGLLRRVNPGAPTRHTAEYALVLDGTFIRGGDITDAPQLKKTGWDFRVVRRERGVTTAWGTLAAEDDLWDEPRPCCEHTLRTCSPSCPEWGGR